ADQDVSNVSHMVFGNWGGVNEKT
ncbi:hypothetical protein LCGC14_2134580, partial [marine sediment metagenome]